ncbi:C1 family peptidase [Fluviispira sanaruensis]|uniref:Peptidase C1 n=1 Tax=Fluviispira sanaruensis TaxID=2493639 RepID=A0A4V0P294_FLUSA|nr:C1 family peptidase [Fluviispira sanaruensis]BBH52437.1 peptidase C1 [Fluviispira sanaruensis]
MRNFSKAKAVISSFALLSIAAYAAGSENYPRYTVEGSQSVTIPAGVDPFELNTDLEALTGYKTIKLMTIMPSAEMLAENDLALSAFKEKIGAEPNYSTIVPFSQSPGAVDLGMNNVPVLNQGQYGTCVTFAATAALDARLSVGDYIDQQCSLALNKNLGDDFWNGAYTAVQILQPLKTYGIIPKSKCFGSTYPTPSQKVSPTQYQSTSDKSQAANINWTYVGKRDINAVKTALKNGHRVAIGSLLSTADSTGVNGFSFKINGKKTNGGLWACDQPGSRNYCGRSNAGHEIVIIGFDDNQKLFKIRNSWGAGVGDSGDYYMSYNFFNVMEMDHTEVK